MTPASGNRLRILMTADAVGGVWQYSLELAAGLAARGADVLLAVMGPAPGAAQRRVAENIPGVTLTHRAHPLDWMRQPPGAADGAARWIAELADDFLPDVIHANGCTGMHLRQPSAPVLLVMHSCVRSWWRAVKGEELPDDWGSYVERVDAALANARLVVAPTAAFLRTIEDIYSVPARTAAVYNGRSPARFHPREKEPVILAAGRVWDEAKNLPAVGRVAVNLPWTTCIAGSDAAPGGDGGTTGRGCRYLGALDEGELAVRLSTAAIFVSPARYEPFGLAVLEAAFSGCALVLSDIETFRELWDDCALFVDTEDAAALEYALRSLIDDADLRRDLAARAQRRAQRYTDIRTAEAYSDLYHGLIEDQASAAPERLTEELCG